MSVDAVFTKIASRCAHIMGQPQTFMTAMALVGALATAYSFQIAIALLALIYLLDMVATVFLIPELKGSELK